jgi:ribosome-associated protein
MTTDETAPGLIRLAPNVTIASSAMTWTQVKSGGPGGQNVNKTESKVELRFAISAITGLNVAAQLRLATLAGSRLVGDELLLTCDETRSARNNRALLLERLCALVVDAKAVPKPRRKTKPSRGSVRRRLEDKAHRGEVKKGRRDEE